MSLQALPQADQIRLQRIAEHVVGLGPRAVAECIAEALAFGDLGRLMAYLRLPGDVLDAVQVATGMAGQFPPQFVTAPADLGGGKGGAATGDADREVA